MNNNKMKLWAIIPVCAIVLLLGGTYAWYVWQTSSDEETIIATDTGYAKVFFDGGSDINGKLKPVSDKSKGMSKEITVSADKEFIEPISFNLYLDINSIDAGLKHESFKFELYKGETLVKAGNFGQKYLNGALSECSKNEGVNHILLTSDVVTTTEAVYTLYTWIDGNMNNPLSMESQNFDFTLHADGQHAILGDINEKPNPLVHNGIIPEGGVYTRGNITYTAGQAFPEGVKRLDKYQYGDYIYIYAELYDPDGIEILCIGWGVSVLDKTKESYGEILHSINGMDINYLYSTFERCTSLITAPEIPDSVISMERAFYECTSLANAPEIPDSVINMYETFKDCTSLTGTVRINSNEVKYLYCPFSRITLPITVEVPEGSTTYDNISAPGVVPDNVTITTFVKE